MSRIGLKPIEIPEGVEVNISPEKIVVKGKKGSLEEIQRPGIDVVKEGKLLILKRKETTQEMKRTHGLMRSLLSNMVKGVSAGFQLKLNIVGVGYKAEVKGKSVTLNLGFSHPIEFPLPAGVEAVYDKTANSLTLSGCDKQVVGEAAAVIRRFRPPEPYKGKGVMLDGEKIMRKVGKTGAK